MANINEALFSAMHDYIKDKTEDNLKNVDELLAKGAQINGKDQYGYTILQHVIMTDNLEFLKYFLTFKPDVNIPESCRNPMEDPFARVGRTALHVLVHRSKLQKVPAKDFCDMLDLLISAGADINAVEYRFIADETKLPKEMGWKTVLNTPLDEADFKCICGEICTNECLVEHMKKYGAITSDKIEQREAETKQQKYIENCLNVYNEENKRNFKFLVDLYQ